MDQSMIRISTDECAEDMVEMVRDTPLPEPLEVARTFQLGLFRALFKVHGVREEIQCFKAVTVALTMRYAFGERDWPELGKKYMNALQGEKARHNTYNVFVRIVDNYPKYLAVFSRLFGTAVFPQSWERLANDHTYQLLASQFADNCGISCPRYLPAFLGDCLSVVPEAAASLSSQYSINRSPA